MEYTITLGNVEQRSGHRRDCAQVVVTIDVTADSREEAVEKLRELVSGGALTVRTAPFTRSLADKRLEALGRVTMTINPDNVLAKHHITERGADVAAAE